MIDPNLFGVTFSSKQCRNFKINETDCLDFLITEMGFRRFRVMSYWDEHEKVRGKYNFTILDNQVKKIEKAGGVMTFCLGARQPRWPESHYPNWALELIEQERYEALYSYMTTVVERYKDHKSIISWQLENEALNRSFGTNGDFNRKRLIHEFKLIKKLDPARPIIMSTSNTWGVPLRHPRPDQFGFTFYRTQYHGTAYTTSKLPWQWYKLRSATISLVARRTSFIHELQAEPWGPQAIWEMSDSEQARSMNHDQLKENIQLAKRTGLYPIDLWGGEWWYWRNTTRSDTSVYETVKQALL